MDDIVAARVRDHSGRWYGFMTWGRIVDRIDGSWVEEVVLAYARKCPIPEIAEVRICESLAEVSTCKYFYEALFHFANGGIPFGPSYDTWRQARLAEFEDGVLDVSFLGPECHAVSLKEEARDD